MIFSLFCHLFPLETVIFICSYIQKNSNIAENCVAMIKKENLQKIFRTEEVETWALNSVSLDIAAGEFVAIMGPSGCGKSTLLNIFGMLDNPTGGTYILNGTDVILYPERQRTRLRKGVIGFVFQSFNLIEELNVFENLEFLFDGQLVSETIL